MNAQPPAATDIDSRLHAIKTMAKDHRPPPRHSLAHETSPASLPPLLRALQDEDSYIRESVLHALMDYDIAHDLEIQHALLRVLAHDTSAQCRATSAELLAVSATAAPALRTAVQDTSAPVRLAAALALTDQGANDAPDLLVELLRHDPDAEVRRVAAFTMDMFIDDVGATILLDACHDRSAPVRAAAMASLSNSELKRENQAVFDTLIAGLRDPADEVRGAAAAALSYSSDRAIPALTTALQDGAVEVRCAALNALATLKADAAVEAIAELLRNDALEKVRVSAAYALSELRCAAASAALVAATHDASPYVRARAARALARHEPAAQTLRTLCGLLHDPHDSVREAAAYALRQPLAPDLPDRNLVLASLSAALTDPSPDVRTSAIAALGEQGDPTSLPDLASALADDAGEVREKALKALANIDPRGQRGHFLAHLTDPSHNVRRAAANGLQLDATAPIPVEVLHVMQAPTTDPYLKGLLAGAIAASGNPDAIPLLLTALREENDLREMLVDALIDLPDPRSLQPMILLLDDEDDEIAAQAALALAAIGDDRAIAPLQSQIARRSAYVRRRIVWALSFFNSSTITPLLMSHLHDEDESVRNTTAEALASICDSHTWARLLQSLPAEQRQTIACCHFEQEDEGRAAEPRLTRLLQWLSGLYRIAVRSKATRRHRRSVRLGTVHYE